jgi:hypothetical protein
MKVIVVGPSLIRQGSGLGWVKHNVCEAFKEQGHNVISLVSVKKEIHSIMASQIVSGEGRSEIPLEIDEILISEFNVERQWKEVKELVKPNLVVVIGDPENVWFVIEEEKDLSIKLVYYYLSEAHTANRYMPISGKDNITDERLDLKALMEEFDLVIPATDITITALVTDCGVDKYKLTDILYLPVWKWEISADAAVEYRRSVQIDPTCKVYYTISMNTVRKRLDQLMLYFKFHLLKKPCDKLVIHTNENGAYDLIAIAGRLGIVRNLRIVNKVSLNSMKGIMSAGDIYLGTPAAEGFGLPLWESLLLAKQVIHTSTGHPGFMLPKLKDRRGTVLRADIPYFPAVGNQVWYAIPQAPQASEVGASAEFQVEDVTETPSDFKVKFINILKEKNICQ